MLKGMKARNLTVSPLHCEHFFMRGFYHGAGANFAYHRAVIAVFFPA